MTSRTLGFPSEVTCKPAAEGSKPESTKDTISFDQFLNHNFTSEVTNTNENNQRLRKPSNLPSDLIQYKQTNQA